MSTGIYTTISGYKSSIYGYICSNFRRLRFIDIEEFHNRPDSMELGGFQNLCMRHIEAAKERLLKK